MSFKTKTIGSYSVLISEVLPDVRHGFIGKSANFSEKVRSQAEREFKKTFNVENIFLPTQMHGRNVIDLRKGSTEKEGDAVIMDKYSCSLAIGVRTADCVPILLTTENAFAVIHAGWKGIAEGIISETISVLNPSSKVISLLGPCAGFESYEVGKEVIDAIGEDAVFRKSLNNKYLLGLEETVKKILHKLLPKESVIIGASICTISNDEHHSYRRDKENRGSNLGFIIA